MASTTPLDTKKLVSSRTRPSATVQPSSPHTPITRSISTSLYGSPAGAFRVDDENLVIFEIGSRLLRAGFAGENSPRHILSYSPDQQRRVGDYRQYAPDYDSRRRRRKKGENWTYEYELWRPDVRDQDLNLLGDRLERLIRDIETTQLMLDARPRKVALVVSSQLPRPLLEIAISSLFSVLQCPTVTLLPSNTMSIVAAGLRSALVIEIGWSETSVSAIFEYREVSQKSSIRASKMLLQEYRKLDALEKTDITVEEAEDILMRIGWCRERVSDTTSISDTPVPISLGSTAFQIQLSELADPPEVLFTVDSNNYDLDDENLPIQLLAYDILLRLPIDIRKTCMSRIVVTGGASNIPGIKRRILQELENVINTRGWDAVRNYGSAGPPRQGDVLIEQASNISHRSTQKERKVTENTSTVEEVAPSVAAHLLPQEPDKILSKIQMQQKQNNEMDEAEGALRLFNSLGPWAGASLTIGLRVRGVVEIERERFISTGLLGGAVKKEVSVTAQRQSMGPGVRQVGAEKSHWNLGVWA
jgi:Actin